MKSLQETGYNTDPLMFIGLYRYSRGILLLREFSGDFEIHLGLRMNHPPRKVITVGIMIIYESENESHSVVSNSS